MIEKQMTSGGEETKKLYYEDSHRKEFKATVLSCEERLTAKGKKDGYAVVLDQTAFFPEGGGQFGDRGWIDDVEVYDTHEKGGVILHYTKTPVEVGTTVTGKLDFAERFSRMQEHSGEHIVSGIVHRLHGYDNVGFHLGSENTTLDFNGELSEEQLQEVERLANEAVFADLPIQISYPSKEELKTLDYRSKIEIEGQVRLVEIPGVDICACCAPHVHNTGEIGMIRLIGMEKYKGGVRIQMLCGFRALADALEKERNVYDISAQLSAKPYEVAAAVEKLKAESLALKQEMNGLKMDILQEKIALLPGDSQNVCFFDKHMDKSNLRYAFNLLAEKCSGLCGCFDGDDEKGYRYVLGGKNVDVVAAGKALNEALEGRGGGSKEMFQGSLQASKVQIEEYFAKV